jgi:hypothetical protein
MFRLFGRPKKGSLLGGTNETPPTDEQIEAEYFPGTIPPRSPQLNIAWDALAPCPGAEQWLVRSHDGLEILVAGGAEQPCSDHLATAKLAVARIEEVREASIRLLQSFVHEPGSWSLDEVDVGTEVDRNRCDFQAALSFSPSDGSDSYGYTSFIVCFQITKATHRTRIHPFKTIIEFL